MTDTNKQLITWPKMQPSKGQSPVLFEDGYAEGYCRAITDCKAALAAQPPTAWSHLPNAVHIDRVLRSLKSHPDKWDAEWEAARYAAWEASRYVVYTAAQTEAWDIAYDAEKIGAWEAARYSARYSARYAIAALVAWDDCAYMLELPDDTLKELREAGNKPAILLSVAAKILKETS